MNEHNCLIGHGYTIVVTDFDGNRSTTHGCGFRTRDEAQQEKLAAALSIGWTAPKWWQWWRWHDTQQL